MPSRLTGEVVEACQRISHERVFVWILDRLAPLLQQFCFSFSNNVCGDTQWNQLIDGLLASSVKQRKGISERGDEQVQEQIVRESTCCNAPWNRSSMCQSVDQNAHIPSAFVPEADCNLLNTHQSACSSLQLDGLSEDEHMADVVQLMRLPRISERSDMQTVVQYGCDK